MKDESKGTHLEPATDYILGESLGREVVGEPEISRDPSSSALDSLRQASHFSDEAPISRTPTEHSSICDQFGCQKDCYLEMITELKAQIHRLEIKLCLEPENR